MTIKSENIQKMKIRIPLYITKILCLIISHIQNKSKISVAALKQMYYRL